MMDLEAELRNLWWIEEVMEMEFFSNVLSEDTVEADVANDNFGVEGERCGICMDLVVDRGVLDCCQHWFCFGCIDSWATIANLCPLCQNEFQLITCVPVYDTIGESRTDEDSDLRYDDWCIEGKDNIHSNPPYYIDENAIICLEGDGCKIRSESVSCHDSLTFDTSIACDLCHIWHHAFCVGFDPENADVDSWLCPRCIELYRTVNLPNSKGADHHRLIDTISGKSSISVADARETAMNVSRISGEHGGGESIVNCIYTQKVNHESGKSMLGTNSCSSDLKNSLNQGKSRIMCETLKNLKADLPTKIGEKRKHTDHSFVKNGYDEMKLQVGSCRRRVKSSCNRC